MSSVTSSAASNCTVCQHPVEKDACTSKTALCGDVFHKNCYKKLASETENCPNCRGSLEGRAKQSGATPRAPVSKADACIAAELLDKSVSDEEQRVIQSTLTADFEAAMRRMSHDHRRALRMIQQHSNHAAVFAQVLSLGDIDYCQGKGLFSGLSCDDLWAELLKGKVEPSVLHYATYSPAFRTDLFARATIKQAPDPVTDKWNVDVMQLMNRLVRVSKPGDHQRLKDFYGQLPWNLWVEKGQCCVENKQACLVIIAAGCVSGRDVIKVLQRTRVAGRSQRSKKYNLISELEKIYGVTSPE
jgi:hypothetical protein